MKFKTFMTLHALVLAFFGFVTLFIASIFWGIYGVRIVEHGVLLARALGSLITANAVLSWFFRDVTDSKALRALVYQQLVAWIFMLVVFVIGQLDGTTNTLGWSNVLLCVIFCYGWLHFGFIKPIFKQ